MTRMERTEISSILVATGLGADSAAPIHLAGLLAGRSSAALHLMHALELQSIAPVVEGGETPSDFQTLIERTGAELRSEARRALPAGIEPESCEVMIYVPYKAILSRAQQVGADLIVLGAHRGRPRGEQLLGPTSDRVIRSAATPCLIVPETDRRAFRRIVAPIDLEMPASAAVDLARRWALEFGPEDGTAEIDLLYIAPEDTAGGEGDAARRTLEDSLQREIERSWGRAGPGEIRSVIRWGGSPADAILEYLHDVDADLVVLGTRGFGAIRRALIGSVASTIARQAPCSVLLVPPVLWKKARH